MVITFYNKKMKYLFFMLVALDANLAIHSQRTGLHLLWLAVILKSCLCE